MSIPLKHPPVIGLTTATCTAINNCQKHCRNRGLALGLRSVQAAALPGEDQADAPEKPLMQLPGVSGPFAVPPPQTEARGSRSSPPYIWLTAMPYSGLLW